MTGPHVDDYSVLLKRGADSRRYRWIEWDQALLRAREHGFEHLETLTGPDFRSIHARAGRERAEDHQKADEYIEQDIAFELAAFLEKGLADGTQGGDYSTVNNLAQWCRGGAFTYRRIGFMRDEKP